MASVIIAYHIIRPKLRQIEQEIDILLITPSDYTCIVKGLGKHFDKEEVKDFFENYGRWDGKPAEVVKVNMAYNIREFVELEREKNKA